MRKSSIKWLACLLAGITGNANAELSANLGWASDYYFRGILQKTSSASGGIDFERNGFYVGTWAADVGDGLEVDGYFGYGAEVGEFDLSAGYTGYFYTGDFDDTYQEINLGGGYGFMTLDVALGRYDNFAGPTLDYSYYAFTVSHEGLFARYGTFGRDFEGSYIEAGYATTVAEFDIGITALFSDEDLVGESSEALIFTIGKSFDIN
ncbi:MAG: TorF family putative porin [Gammaproteobacteria bacterium]|nr:TorF family putative porin [Gammaproteobacteria bacterium]